MKHYAVAQFDVTERSWVRDYVSEVTPMVEARGGRYLARTAAFERIEGDGERAQMCMIIEWSSKQAALEFYDSDEYRPFRERRIAGSRGEFLLVAGEDSSGVARVP